MPPYPTRRRSIHAFGVITTFTLKTGLQLFKNLGTPLYTMMAKPIKTLELHYPMIQFLIYFIEHIHYKKFDFLEIFITRELSSYKSDITNDFII